MSLNKDKHFASNYSCISTQCFPCLSVDFAAYLHVCKMMGPSACTFYSLCLKTVGAFLPHSNLFLLNCVLSRAGHNSRSKDQECFKLRDLGHWFSMVFCSRLTQNSAAAFLREQRKIVSSLLSGFELQLPRSNADYLKIIFIWIKMFKKISLEIIHHFLDIFTVPSLSKIYSEFHSVSLSSAKWSFSPVFLLKNTFAIILSCSSMFGKATLILCIDT